MMMSTEAEERDRDVVRNLARERRERPGVRQEDDVVGYNAYDLVQCEDRLYTAEF